MRNGSVLVPDIRNTYVIKRWNVEYTGLRGCLEDFAPVRFIFERFTAGYDGGRHFKLDAALPHDFL